MGVIRCRHHHGIEVRLLQTLAPVHVLLGVGELLGRRVQMLLVDIAEGHHVFVGQGAMVGMRSPPGAY